MANATHSKPEPKLTLRLSFFLRTIHPAAVLFLWLMAMLVAGSQELMLTTSLAILTCVMAIAASPQRFFLLLRRSRWLLLATAFSFALSTPGEITPWLSFVTYDGLLLATEQLLRLLLMLSMVSTLLVVLDTPHMLQAIYTLLYPYEWIGGDRHRVVVRLALTIDPLRGQTGVAALAATSSSMSLRVRMMRPLDHLIIFVVVLFAIDRAVFSAVL